MDIHTSSGSVAYVLAQIHLESQKKWEDLTPCDPSETWCLYSLLKRFEKVWSRLGGPCEHLLVKLRSILKLPQIGIAIHRRFVTCAPSWMQFKSQSDWKEQLLRFMDNFLFVFVLRPFLSTQGNRPYISQGIDNLCSFLDNDRYFNKVERSSP